MEYKINSNWTREQKNDVEKLNKILDNSYCQELEISRKINIMKEFESSFKKEIENIYWDNILDYMKTTNWVWVFPEHGIYYERTPSKEEMIKRLKDLFEDGLFNIIKLGKTEYICSTGGFTISLHMINNHYNVDILFDIAHYTK